MKSTNRKEHGSALTKLQKLLTLISSILGIITACITIYAFTAKSTVANTSPSSSVTTVSSTNLGHTSSINQIGKNNSATSPSTEITSPNGECSSSTTEKSSSSSVTETSSSQEIQTSTTETTSGTENSTEASTSSSQEEPDKYLHNFPWFDILNLGGAV
ncbi:TPA: DUF6556 family protein [Streptococcus suis]